MDLNFLLLLTVGISCFSFILRTIFSSHNRGWTVVAGSILGVTGVMLSVAPQWAGLVGGSLWGMFLVLPMVGLSRVNQLIVQERYPEARRLISVVRWLHPFDGWLEQPQILRALEMGQQGRMAEALKSLHPHDGIDHPMGRNATALLLVMEARWQELLRWFENHIPEQLLLKDAHLMMYYLRALGETGDLNGLIWGLERYEPYLRKGGNNALPLHLSRLFALAFTGQVEGVEYLLKHNLSGYDLRIKTFWRLTTAQVAAPSPIITRKFQALQERESDIALQRAIAWRLQQPPKAPQAVLSAKTWQVVEQIQQTIQHEVHYAQPLSLKPTQATVTYGLIGLNILMFALEIYYGGSQNPQALDRLGALIPYVIPEGQWWRLLNANFLHYGVGHLLTNLLGLYLLGPFVEARLGRWHYLLAYLFTGVGTMGVFTVLALAQNNPYQRLVGASAAIMGLLGIIVVILWQGWLQERRAQKMAIARQRANSPTPTLQSRVAAERLRTFIVIIVLQFTFDFLIPEISSTAHTTGLILGMAWGIMIVFGPFRGRMERQWR